MNQKQKILSAIGGICFVIIGLWINHLNTVQPETLILFSSIVFIAFISTIFSLKHTPHHDKTQK